MCSSCLGGSSDLPEPHGRSGLQGRGQIAAGFGQRLGLNRFVIYALSLCFLQCPLVGPRPETDVPASYFAMRVAKGWA